jgi:hypothetical protein
MRLGRREMIKMLGALGITSVIHPDVAREPDKPAGRQNIADVCEGARSGPGLDTVGMLYRPPCGRIWDPSLMWHNGNYYFFAMYDHGAGDTSVWAATSTNGVQWHDIGAVINNAPFKVWKMFVFKHGDHFVMNHGSQSDTQATEWANDTLRFWLSEDLTHWNYAGSKYDTHPDPRWYKGLAKSFEQQGRWDHMYVIPKEHAPGYWGYCVAKVKGDRGGCGMLESLDGLKWRVLPPPVFDFGDLPAGWFEHSGCAKVNGKYYLIGGCSQYMGNFGYSVYTLVSDDPTGPFVPDKDAYRLCGSSGQDGIWGWQFLAAMANCNGDLLLSQYAWLSDSPSGHAGIPPSNGQVWFVPIKKAVVDTAGHLRMAYWSNNDAARGTPISLDFSRTVRIFTSRGLDGGAKPQANGSDGTLDLATANAGRIENASIGEAPNVTFDLTRGVIIEGSLMVKPENDRPAYVGFLVEAQSNEGRAILLNCGHPAWRKSVICDVHWRDEQLDMKTVDITGPGCATVTGVDEGVNHAFRLWVRGGLLELYIDDLLMQTFPSIKLSTGRIGFFVQNAEAVFRNVHAWEMSL